MKIEEIPFDRIFPAPQELTPQEKANREKFKKFLEYVKSVPPTAMYFRRRY